MRSLLLLAAAAVMVAGFPLVAHAVERNVSDVVLVDSGSVIDDDLYAAGNRVVIQGRVDGDLIVSAFEDVTITGTVTGDVIAFAATSHIGGRVDGSVRIVTGSATMDGVVGGDVVAVAWDMTMDGTVDGDVLLWARSGLLGAEVGGDLEGQIRRLILAGTVTGNVDVTVDSLSMGEGASVGGDLGYRSPTPAEGLDRSAVEGALVHRTPLVPNIRVRAMVLLGKVVMSLAAGVAGLVVMYVAPRASAAATARVRRSWLRSWLRGAALAVVPVAAASISFGLLALVPLEAALPVFVAMIPVVLALFGLVAALALVAPAAVYPWVGDPGGKRRGQVRSFLIGLVAATLAFLLPWVGWVAAAVVIPIGIGGWLGTEAVTDES